MSMLSFNETIHTKPLPASLRPLAHKEADDDSVEWLKELLADDSISEIMINRPDRIFVEKQGVVSQLPFALGSEEAVMDLARYLLALCDKGMVVHNPIVDCTMPDGNRCTVIFPPAAIGGVNIAIRKNPRHMLTLDAMVDMGTITPHIAIFLKSLAKSRVNILVSGGPSSGKTTLLNALSEFIGSDERIATIEETPELALQHADVVSLQSDNTNLSQGELLKSALRMRCDRVIMGELRGGEAFDFLQAINIGHYGSMSTLHANTPRDALMRLELMVDMSGANLAPHFIHQQIASALNIIIQTNRHKNGRRSITHIAEITGMEGDVIIMQDLFAPDPQEENSYAWANVGSRNPYVHQAMMEARAYLDRQSA